MANLLEYHPGAREDFDDAFDWYAVRSPGAAVGFVSEIDAAIEKIVADPWRFAKTYAGCRYCSLKHYPFSVVFYIMPAASPVIPTTMIIAVAHSKRRPGYWRSRL